MSPASRPRRIRRVLLVGFMGSGKSTVGPLLADALGWTFHDSDSQVEARAGMSVPDIFTQAGEAGFRQLESDVMRELLATSESVLASGGGWAVQPGALDEAPTGTLSVWLEVTPETAVERIARTGSRRPLLSGPDPVGTAKALMAEREVWYAKSELACNTESMSPTDISEQIAETVRSR